MTVCIGRGWITGHFAGRLSVRQERAMREHLPGCDSCRRFYERNALMGRLDPEALGAEERIARGLGFDGARLARRRRALLGSGLTALAAAAGLLFVLRAPAPGNDAGFTARGGALPPGPTVSRVLVYAVHGTPRAVRSGDRVDGHEELAFSYENASAKARLMIFGVDEHRHVYWFYPSWTREADDPGAIAIAQDGARHELPDAIRQPLDGKALELHALFVDAPLTVREVEGMIAGPLDAMTGSLSSPFSSTLTIAGAVESVTSLTVVP